MPIPGINFLETINIKIGHGYLLIATARKAHGLSQAIGKQNAVRQAGEAVVMGHALKLEFVLLERGYVGAVRHVFDDIAMCVANCVDGKVLSVDIAVLGAIPDLT